MSDFAKKHYGWDTTADATSESSSSPTSMPEGFEAVIRRIAKYPQDMVLNEAQRGNLSFAITNSKVSKIAGADETRANFGFLSKNMELVPILSEYLGNSTHAKLAIITPYLKQQHYYNLALEGLRKEGTSADALPKVYTVEEAEGCTGTSSSSTTSTPMPMI